MGRMRSSDGGSKRVIWLVQASILMVLLLCILLSTCNAGTSMLNLLGIRESRLEETRYNDITLKTLKGSPLNKGGRAIHVLDSEAQVEVIHLLKQALAAKPSKKEDEDVDFEFFSGQLKGKAVYVFRSTKTGSVEQCTQILNAMKTSDTTLFKTPLVYASSESSGGRFFLGYIIPETTSPLLKAVVKRVESYGVEKLPPIEEERKD